MEGGERVGPGALLAKAEIAFLNATALLAAGAGEPAAALFVAAHCYLEEMWSKGAGRWRSYMTRVALCDPATF